MPRLKVENHARKHLAAFLGLAFLTAMIRQPDAGWEAAAMAIGGWGIVLAGVYRKAMTDRRAPRTSADALQRQVAPTLIGAVFWLLGWFFGAIALGLAWKYKKTLEKAPESIRQTGGFARLLALLSAGGPQGGEAESGRAAPADMDSLFSVERQPAKRDPWEALEAAEKEAKKAIVREAEPAPPVSAVVAEPPAVVETVVPAAEPSALPPLPDLFARSATEPVSAPLASTDPLGEFKNPSAGFDDVLAMLQGRPASSGKGSGS
ncbi:MAG: hypothetical protein ACLGIN_00960 [Candidatus Sericytochromatia bacterium]